MLASFFAVAFNSAAMVVHRCCAPTRPVPSMVGRDAVVEGDLATRTAKLCVRWRSIQLWNKNRVIRQYRFQSNIHGFRVGTSPFAASLWLRSIRVGTTRRFSRDARLWDFDGRRRCFHYIIMKFWIMTCGFRGIRSHYVRRQL